MTASDAVIIFARLPVPGKVKTRLAAGVGADRACSFYSACAAHIFSQAVRCGSALPGPAPPLPRVCQASEGNPPALTPPDICCRVPAAVPHVYNAKAADNAAMTRWLQSLDLVSSLSK